MDCEQRDRVLQERGRTRGACPGAFTPMASGDGWLVRIRTGARALSSHDLRELARLARENANGIIELTRRASLQLRGVRLERISELQAALIALGLVDASPVREARPGLLVDPVAVIEDAELAELGEALDAALAESAELGGLAAKLGIVLDAGSGSVTDVDADIRVVASSAADQVRVYVGTHAGAVLLGACTRAHAPDAVKALLGALSDFARPAVAAEHNESAQATPAARDAAAHDEHNKSAHATPAARDAAAHDERNNSTHAMAAARDAAAYAAHSGTMPPRQPRTSAIVSEHGDARATPRMRDFVAARGVEALRVELGAHTAAAASSGHQRAPGDRAGLAAAVSADHQCAPGDRAGLAPHVSGGHPCAPGDRAGLAAAVSSGHRRAPRDRAGLAAPATAVRSADANTRPTPLLAAPVSTAALPMQPQAALGLSPGMFGIGVPFGSASHAEWVAIAELAERFGTGEVRLTPRREVLIRGVQRELADRLAQVASRLGFITEPHDPRLQVIACSGAPACSSAYGETRTLASALLPLLAAGTTLHVSGCEKACASRAAAAVSIVLAQDGARLALNADVAAASCAPVEPLATISAKLSSREPVRMTR